MTFLSGLLSLKVWVLALFIMVFLDDYFKPLESIFGDYYIFATILAGYVISVLIFKFGATIFRDRNLKCAWCNNWKELEYVSGDEGNWYWERRNKDGSRDKRVKDNYQTATFISTWECSECNARSKFIHAANKKPSTAHSVTKRTLLKNGSGDRTGSDY